MTTPAETHAKRILYILVNEQGLRAGDGLSVADLTEDLVRHQISEPEQQAALQYAHQQGWLQTGPYGEVQLTEAGFAVD
ncbi:hypothetical protein GCM10027082_33070 [Comamonas humi]